MAGSLARGNVHDLDAMMSMHAPDEAGESALDCDVCSATGGALLVDSAGHCGAYWPECPRRSALAYAA